MATGPRTFDRFRFHERCGSGVTLMNGSLTAKRDMNREEKDPVLSRDPMKVNHMYEVRLEKVNERYRQVTVGVTTDDPVTLLSRPFKVDDPSCFLLTSHNCMAWGKEFLKRREFLEGIREGGYVGLLLDDKRDLHIYITSRHYEVVTTNVPDPCYFLFLLGGRCYQISTEPVKEHLYPYILYMRWDPSDPENPENKRKAKITGTLA